MGTGVEDSAQNFRFAQGTVGWASLREMRVLVLISFALLAGCHSAHADDLVVHEFVPHPSDSELPSLISGPGEEPAAIVYNGEVLPAPEGGALGDEERAMSPIEGTSNGHADPGRRSPTFRPDRVTALEGSLGYFSVFTPTVAPFKRVSALDAVVRTDNVPVLGVADPTSAVIDVVGVDAPNHGIVRDRFWGSVVLDFTEGGEVPFPSIAPESRILTLRTEPPTDLRIEKDRADNFYATNVGGIRGPVRVVFLMDAPRNYFAVHEIPDAPVDSMSAMIPMALDSATAAEADRFVSQLGLSQRSRLPEALSRLTEHFRSFEESEDPPPSTQSIFLDLARAQKGVCRHRAYAFVIAAQYLGIPSRFVQNEAHAWVEVLLPEAGWMRIDLGGAASALEAHGSQDQPVYRPGIADPLPQPEAYRRSYSQLRGNVSGLRTSDPLMSNGVTAHQGLATSPRRPAPTEAGPSDPLESFFRPASNESRPVARPLRLRLTTRTFNVFRGRMLPVVGRAFDPDGGGVAGLRVEVLLRQSSERLLGVTVSGEDGAFRAVVGVPSDLSVGEYELIVRSPGNEAFLPATAH